MSVQCACESGRPAAGLGGLDWPWLCVAHGMCYLCAWSSRGPGPTPIMTGTQGEGPSPPLLPGRQKGASLLQESQLPEPHSFYGVLLLYLS